MPGHEGPIQAEVILTGEILEALAQIASSITFDDGEPRSIESALSWCIGLGKVATDGNLFKDENGTIWLAVL